VERVDCRRSPQQPSIRGVSGNPASNEEREDHPLEVEEKEALIVCELGDDAREREKASLFRRSEERQPQQLGMEDGESRWKPQASDVDQCGRATIVLEKMPCKERQPTKDDGA
jgi:hypothetical protein